MKYKVLIIQNIKYPERIVAEFETMEQAAIFCDTVLHACKNMTVSISNYEESEVGKG